VTKRLSDGQQGADDGKQISSQPVQGQIEISLFINQFFVMITKLAADLMLLFPETAQTFVGNVFKAVKLCQWFNIVLNYICYV
jgi:hypothetical protein